MLELNKIYYGDCLELALQIESGSVDLILTDLPYGNMYTTGLEVTQNKKQRKHDWDLVIEPKRVYEIANKILRKNGKMILFSQEPYTSQLIIQSHANIPFSYRAIWEKDNFAVSLGVNRNMVSYFEDILIFSKTHDTKDLHPLRNYLKDCKNKSELTNRQFNNLFSEYTNKKGNRNRSILEHYWAAAQFCLPTREIYEKILQPTGFFPISYDELKKINNEFKAKFPSIFNLWEGNKYKSNILKYKKDYEGLHPTQKPILLLKDLIKTFSNENDLIVDLTAGSGSTIIACIQTNRNFIGIEINPDYVEIANRRLANTYRQMELIK